MMDTVGAVIHKRVKSYATGAVRAVPTSSPCGVGAERGAAAVEGPSLPLAPCPPALSTAHTHIPHVMVGVESVTVTPGIAKDAKSLSPLPPVIALPSPLPPGVDRVLSSSVGRILRVWRAWEHHGGGR